jgi:hypothetical protein
MTKSNDDSWVSLSDAIEMLRDDCSGLVPRGVIPRSSCRWSR